MFITTIDPHTHNNVVMPKEMRELLRALPELESQTHWWRYNYEAGDFVPIQKPRQPKRFANYFIDCIMNPRELCTRETLMSLAPYIFMHMRIPSVMAPAFVMQYTSNIVERAYD